MIDNIIKQLIILFITLSTTRNEDGDGVCLLNNNIFVLTFLQSL